VKYFTDLQMVLQSPFGRRIFLRMTGYVLSFSLLFFSIAMYMEYRNLNKELLSDGQQLADIYAHAVHIGIFTEDRELLQNPTDALLSHPEVQSACAIAKDGRLLMQDAKTSGEANETCFQSSAEDTAIRKKTLSTGHAQIFRTGKAIHLWTPVYTSGENFSREKLLLGEPEEKQRQQLLGAVGIVMDRTSIKTNMHRLFISFLLLNLLFILLAVFLTIRVARDASTPLRSLLQRFDIEKGSSSNSDEITRLSGTFDRIIDDLNSAFSTIRNLKVDLENKVTERTAELAGRQQELMNANAMLEKTIADLKSTQSQLVQSEKMAALGQLVAGMAHEINNTINFVSGALPPMDRTINQIRSLCNRSGATPGTTCRDRALLLFDDLDQLVTNIAEGAARTARIVKDLRDFSRPDLTEATLPDIHHGLDVTLALIRTEYKHRITIIKNYGTDIGLVPCFANQLNQVFTNLLLNAIQAINGEGTITISTAKDAKAIHIRFADTGCGIPTSVIDHIFDPFFTTKEVGKGTGLGLSISYTIIKNHGGEIKVKSEVGKGSKFEIILPAG
jgi:signal transduction histidine kinase